LLEGVHHGVGCDESLKGLSELARLGGNVVALALVDVQNHVNETVLAPRAVLHAEPNGLTVAEQLSGGFFLNDLEVAVETEEHVQFGVVVLRFDLQLQHCGVLAVDVEWDEIFENLSGVRIKALLGSGGFA
jgi:hypothetical protein